jgi:hypothetical protein
MNTDCRVEERFKEYFRVLHESDLSDLRNINTDGIVLRDPVHEIRAQVAPGKLAICGLKRTG